MSASAEIGPQPFPAGASSSAACGAAGAPPLLMASYPALRIATTAERPGTNSGGSSSRIRKPTTGALRILEDRGFGTSAAGTSRSVVIPMLSTTPVNSRPGSE